MRSLFHSEATYQTDVESAADRVVQQFRVDTFATVEARLLRSVEPDAQRMGSKPLHTLRDETGNRYILKVGKPELLAAEQAAYELRRLARRPCLPTRIVSGQIEGLGEVTGLLKPFLEFDPKDELVSDTTQWTELQRSVLLLEHAWEYFTDNLDTNSSQYALLGPNRYPVNIDWDRAFASEGRASLSRFVKYRAVLPNARTFLYSDYVEGKIDLPFSLLRREARLIRRLPDRDVRPILERYAAVRYADDPRAAIAFVERVLRRKHHIEHEVARFIRELLKERLELSVLPKRTFFDHVRMFLTLAWDQWQRVLNAVARGRIGTMGRRMLKFARGLLWRPASTAALVSASVAAGAGAAL